MGNLVGKEWRVTNLISPKISVQYWTTRSGHFVDCDFKGSTFIDTSLHDVVFEKCDFSECQAIDIAKAGSYGTVDFEQCNFHNAQIKWVASIDDSDRLLYTKCNLDRCSFKDSIMFNVDFKNNYGLNVDFSNAVIFLNRYTIGTAFWMYQNGAKTVGLAYKKEKYSIIPRHAPLLRILARFTKYRK